MQITLTSVDPRADETIVSFSCRDGAASARWHGSPPIAGEERHVELDVDEEEIVSLRPVSGPGGSIRAEASVIHIEALVESIASDGVATLRLGASVFQLDLKSLEHERISVGSSVELTVRRLDLYDAGY